MNKRCVLTLSQSDKISKKVGLNLLYLRQMIIILDDCDNNGKEGTKK